MLIFRMNFIEMKIIYYGGKTCRWCSNLNKCFLHYRIFFKKKTLMVVVLLISARALFHPFKVTLIQAKLYFSFPVHIICKQIVLSLNRLQG